MSSTVRHYQIYFPGCNGFPYAPHPAPRTPPHTPAHRRMSIPSVSVKTYKSIVASQQPKHQHSNALSILQICLLPPPPPVVNGIAIRKVPIEA